MRPTPRKPLVRFSLELVGLAVLATAIAVIAAYHLFGGFASESARRALLFCVTVPILSTVPIQLYALVSLSRLRRENRQLFHVATRDGLTQVLNRTTFKQCAEAEIGALSHMPGGTLPHTLLILDADHFKRINDRLGHHVGDTALTAIAATLRRSVRRDDLVGRLGGEEFAVLLRNAGPEEAMLVAERLRATIHGIEVGPPDARTRLSVSIGGISFRSGVAFDALYKIADANLYKAKRTGRNRTELTRLGQFGTGGPTIEGRLAPAALPPPRQRRRVSQSSVPQRLH